MNYTEKEKKQTQLPQSGRKGEAKASSLVWAVLEKQDVREIYVCWRGQGREG